MFVRNLKKNYNFARKLMMRIEVARTRRIYI